LETLAKLKALVLRAFCFLGVGQLDVGEHRVVVRAICRQRQQLELDAIRGSDSSIESAQLIGIKDPTALIDRRLA
jgi:hypothetical protein